jgi:hypothetical protein
MRRDLPTADEFDRRRVTPSRVWRRVSLPALVLVLLPGCSGGSDAPQTDEGSSGGNGTNAGAGGTSPGGGASASGGTAFGSGGAITNSGGTIANGGLGGALASGGMGGAPPTGTGGSSSGTGGTSTGGTTGTSGSGGNGGSGGSATCPLPTSFQWTSTGSLAEPKSPSGHNFVSLKDFTVVHSQNQFIVYATVFDTTASWSGVNFNFTDWSQAGQAPQTYLGPTPLGGAVAPNLFYFTPKNLWVLTYQWGFKYATTTDPTKPSTWSSPKGLMTGDPTGGTGTGPIDQTVICDAKNCYLFFAGDNGHIYRASMPIANFPGTFTGAASILSDTQAKLFEAVQVYTVKGAGTYLMIVEAMGGGGRYFRAFTAPSLDGTFTAMSGASTEAAPFAGKSNVTFTGAAWTNDISHGDMVREDPSETQTIDPCNMQFLYQGRDPKSTASYGELPYRPGLLTRKN